MCCSLTSIRPVWDKSRMNKHIPNVHGWGTGVLFVGTGMPMPIEQS
jgi:hypothetical protein